MSTEAMLRELEMALAAIHAEKSPQQEVRSIGFIRDHGPALAEMVKDAKRYRKIRLFHEARIGRKKATVVMWGDEPWEPSNGGELDKAIDAARGIG